MSGILNTTVSSVTQSASASDQFTVIVASLSCLGLSVLIVLLLCQIFRKSHCCISQAYEGSQGNLETSSPFYNSRQTLVGSPCMDVPFSGFDNLNSEPGQMFYVGMPGPYNLPPNMDLNMPRLPSYESVRKKDRQRQIHMMIADRFGLNEPTSAEQPPTYEDSVRQSLQSLVATPAGMLSNPVPPLNVFPQNETQLQIAAAPDLTNTNSDSYADPPVAFAIIPNQTVVTDDQTIKSDQTATSPDVDTVNTINADLCPEPAPEALSEMEPNQIGDGDQMINASMEP